MLRKILASLLIVTIASPAYALRDHYLDSDYQGTDVSYTTGRFTTGSLTNHVEFKPASHPVQLPTGDWDDFILQPEKLDSDLKSSADWVFPQEDNRSIALLLIDKGRIVYERNDYPDAEFNSWSMSKSITSMLVGKALCQGDIKSLDDIAGTYVPEIKDSVYGKATIRELLSMTSGAPPPGDNKGVKGAGSNAGDHWEITRGMIGITKFINDAKQDPGPKVNRYNNMDINAVGLVLDSTKKGSKGYMQELLNEAGVEKESHWIIDRDNHLNFAYGYGASLHDWARISQYSLDIMLGRTNNKCMQQYMKEAVTPVTPSGKTDDSLPYTYFGYGLGMWTHPSGDGRYTWLGMYGQKVWVDPKHELILIVFRNRNSYTFAQKLGHFWDQWYEAHEPRPEDVANGVVPRRGKVAVDFVEAPKDTKDNKDNTKKK